jgi:hypothetical protein
MAPRLAGIDAPLAIHMNKFTLICLWLALSSTTHATSLNPGSTVGPIPVLSYGSSQFPSGNSNNGAAGPNAALQGGSWSAGLNLAGAAINYADAVYTDPTNGDLEFFYQMEASILGNPLDASSADLSTVIDGCTLSGLNITGVAQITSATFNPFGSFAKPTSPTNSISSLSLSSNDQDLTIDFAASVAPGDYSTILMIETTATTCDPDNGSGNNGSVNSGGNSGATGLPATSPGGQSGSGSSGVPVVTPEPSVYGILSLGSIGLLLLVHRRQHKEQDEG